MKIWVDDVRPAPDGYVWCKSVDEAKETIFNIEFRNVLAELSEEYYPLIDIDDANNIINIEVIDIDHDAGDYACDGGDYIKLLDWLEETDRAYPIHIHSMNPVGVENMRAIIKRNGWKEL